MLKCFFCVFDTVWLCFYCYNFILRFFQFKYTYQLMYSYIATCCRLHNIMCIFRFGFLWIQWTLNPNVQRNVLRSFFFSQWIYFDLCYPILLSRAPDYYTYYLKTYNWLNYLVLLVVSYKNLCIYVLQKWIKKHSCLQGLSTALHFNLIGRNPRVQPWCLNPANSWLPPRRRAGSTKKSSFRGKLGCWSCPSLWWLWSQWDWSPDWRWVQ